jgi:hypothetical protein
MSENMTKNRTGKAVPGMGLSHPGTTPESTVENERLSLLESAIVAGDFGDPGVAWV